VALRAEELQDRAQLRAKIEEALKELQEREEDHLHEGEPEARMMQCEGKGKFGYNAQVAVAERSGMIVAQEVVEETVADGGYNSAKALGEAQERGYSVLVNRSQEAAGLKKRGESLRL
jgi:hypothetical protein